MSDLSIRIEKTYDWETRFLEVLSAHPKKKVLISEGDSWFSYPASMNKPKNGNGNVIDWLERQYEHGIQKYITLRLETGGDEALAMLSGGQKHRLRKVLTDDRWNTRINALLFSGGGNDIVGEGDMPLFLNKRENGWTWDKCINHDRFERMIDQLRLAYWHLVDLRDAYLPNIPIITHGYDWVIPSDEGAMKWPIKVGPWMKPFMDDLDIRNRDDQRAIAKHFLNRFNDTLLELAADSRITNFHVLDNRGAIAESEWLNEIHPTSPGFEKIANSFLSRLTALGI